ncbi:hypothetical protein Tco_0447896 [Tanacetum coccineum]
MTWMHKHMTGNLKLLCKFVEKFLGTVRFGNDQFAQFLVIWRSDSREIYITTSSLQSVSLANASPIKPGYGSRLSHLNFDYITLPLKKETVFDSLPKLKICQGFQLCSSCEMSKAKRSHSRQNQFLVQRTAEICFTWTYVVPMREETPEDSKRLSHDESTQFFKLKLLLFVRDEARNSEQGHSMPISKKKALKNSSNFPLLGTPEQTGVCRKRTSKGYRVYNKRTRLIVESIHIKFDEIKEMMSDHNSSDLAPQRQEMSVENVSSGLVPGQKASDYDNSDPCPRQMLSLQQKRQIRHNRVRISLPSFTDAILQSNTRSPLRKTTNDQDRMHHFKEMN